MLVEQLKTGRLLNELAYGTAKAKLSRFDRVRIRKAGKNERVIAYEARHMAESVSDIHAGIFPDMLDCLASDIDEMGKLLQAEDIGDYAICVSSGIGAWITCAHDQIVESSARVISIEQRTFSISPQPFLTTVEELKMIRRIQLSINRATKDLNTKKLAAASPEGVDKRMMNWLAHRQARLVELAQKLSQSLGK